MSTNENDLRGVAGRNNFARRWETGRLFWFPARIADGTVGLGLTGNDGVRFPSVTLPALEDLSVLAGTTDLEASFLTMRDASERAFSNADVQIRQVFGKRQLTRNYKYFRPPFLIKKNNHLLFDVLNQGAEVGGNLVLMSDPVNAPRKVVEIPAHAYPFHLVHSLALAGIANERKTLETTPTRQAWTLLWGAGTNISVISVRVRDAEGEWWMNDPVPLWAFAAFTPFTADPRTMGQVITQLWPRAYLIPPGGALQIEATNPAAGMEAGGEIYFDAVRWPVS